jgi:hypothetical protein
LIPNPHQDTRWRTSRLIVFRFAEFGVRASVVRRLL